MLLPFVWMTSLSLKPPGEIFRTSFSLLPDHWYAMENYGKALTAAALPRYMANGVLVCVAILALQILICTPCAYALAKLEFRGRDLLFGLVLVGLLIPHQVLAVPLFVLGYSLGLLNSYAALIFPFIVSPFGIFLIRQFFRSIPNDVVHAARLDGLSEFAIVWRIMLPMAMPAVIAFSIFSVVSHWNDLFWPLIAVKSPNSDASGPGSCDLPRWRSQHRIRPADGRSRACDSAAHACLCRRPALVHRRADLGFPEITIWWNARCGYSWQSLLSVG